MHRVGPCPQRLASLLVPTIVLALITGGAFANDSQGNHSPDPKYEFSEVAVTDVAAMKIWAEDWCRGATVHDLAVAFGVEETKAAVIDHLVWGLAGDVRQAVIDICERELAESPADGF